jgi:LacI family transcriptional regulator
VGLFAPRRPHVIAATVPAARSSPDSSSPPSCAVTIGAIRALQELGLHDRVAVVGFDDFPRADLLQPRVTVVAQDPPRSAAPPRRWSSDASTVNTGHPRNTSFPSS